MPLWLAPLLGFLQPLLDKFLPDKSKQAELQAQLQTLALQQEGAELDAQLKVAIAQTQVDQAEAASGNLFESGWRPAVGWICVAAFAYDFVLRPLGTWIAQLASPKAPLPPNLDLSEMMPVLLGMLGLGAMHSFDRAKGTVPGEK